MGKMSSQLILESEIKTQKSREDEERVCPEKN